METVGDRAATNITAFASWHPAARIRDLANFVEAGAYGEASAVRQSAVSGATADNAFVDLVVSTFKSFREVGGFQRALASIPEAGNIRVRQLHQGKLQVSVQCRSAGGLLRSLSAAYERSFKVLAREPHRIELELLDVD